ncbi:MAG TPA: nodulation protein NfeD [candidate division WOR-3 bacterium]|uniref:Nodulation protein NfeD n=1 Tax=candidate division WOR-3 bacterium TaxID=2052148 RepID=A0A7C0XCD7_UNCW3|nr:nodulation protein NfeD [candidate division WOR-3 bacterium]
MNALLFALFLVQTPSPRIFSTEVQGVIGPVVAEFLTKTIDRAEEEGAQMLVINLDTPGGLDESMRIIVKKMLNARIPICVYVTPPGARAASAGVFITAAAHVAAMAPGTNIGAAHPVSMGQKMDSTMIEKVTNDAVAYMKSIARKRGRNEKWLERSVRESESITSEEALKLGVIDLIALDLNELLKKLDGRKIALDGDTVVLRTSEAEVVEVKMGLRERLLSILTNPNIAYILLILGFYGLFFELSHPGAILPGVVGAISIILAFYSLQTLPVNYAGLLLIVLAMVLFFAELHIQSHGLLGLGGAVSFFLGSLMLFGSNAPFLRISMGLILTVTGLTALFFLFILAKAILALKRKPATGAEGLIGSKGFVTQPIKGGRGTVMVHGELWQARSDEDIEKGEEIEVTGADGLTMIVRKKSKSGD